MERAVLAERRNSARSTVRARVKSASVRSAPSSSSTDRRIRIWPRSFRAV